MQLTKGAAQQVLSNTSPDIIDQYFGQPDGMIFQPWFNIWVGSQYLAWEIQRMDGNIEKALDASGTGSGYGAKILACETALKAATTEAQRNQALALAR